MLDQCYFSHSVIIQQDSVLHTGEAGEIRLEIEVYPTLPTSTYKPPRPPTLTPIPNVTISPSVTPLPLVATSELDVRNIMLARLQGIHVSRFSIDTQTPNNLNGKRYIERGSVGWWTWIITPKNADSVGLNQLEIVITVEDRDLSGSLETVRGEPLKFSINVVDSVQTDNILTRLPSIVLVGSTIFLSLILVSVFLLSRSRVVKPKTAEQLSPLVLKSDSRASTKNLFNVEPSMTNTSTSSKINLYSNATLEALAESLYFVSYAHSDKEFATKLVYRLRIENHRISYDQDLRLGEPWDDQLQGMLNKCTHVLFIASPNSANSENVKDELNKAKEYRKPIITVMYQDCDLPLNASRQQWVDFREDFESGINKLLRYMR